MKYKNTIKRVTLYFLACLLLIVVGINTRAATRKKINKVSLNIKADIQVDTKVGTERIDIQPGNGHYFYDSYEFENFSPTWTRDDAPKLKIKLVAEGDYYFNVSLSDIKVNGTGLTVVDTSKADNDEVLYVTVKFPSLSNQMSSIDKVELSEDGKVHWNASEGAGSYEVKLMRGANNATGDTYSTISNNYDVRQYLVKDGTYTVQVRGISGTDSNFAGAWVNSNSIKVSRDKADAVKREVEAEQSVGTWTKDEKGYRFIDNKGYVARSSWKKINGEWYFFDNNAYMVTGWYLVNNAWYYMDAQSGAMLKNTTTPDGYKVGIDGAYIAQN
jgi:putative cell wall binding repeat-containing protein